VVLVGFLCEEVNTDVFVAWLHTDGLRGDVAIVLVWGKLRIGLFGVGGKVDGGPFWSACL